MFPYLNDLLSPFDNKVHNYVPLWFPEYRLHHRQAVNITTLCPLSALRTDTFWRPFKWMESNAGSSSQRFNKYVTQSAGMLCVTYLEVRHSLITFMHVILHVSSGASFITHLWYVFRYLSVGASVTACLCLLLPNFEYVIHYVSLSMSFVTYLWIRNSLLSFRYVIRYSCLSTYFLTYLTNNFTWKQKLAEMAFEKLIKLR